MGSLVVVGVGTLEPLARAIFFGSLPWAGKTDSEHWEKLIFFHWKTGTFAVNHLSIL